jgi:hypothetical protein
MTYAERHGVCACRLPGETGHQYALRTVEGYDLDCEGHSKECVLRFADCIEAGCSNDSGCISDLPDESGALFHECEAPEHLIP